MPNGIDASKIGGGVIDNTEFSYLNGVTSAIQTQLNAKALREIPDNKKGLREAFIRVGPLKRERHCQAEECRTFDNELLKRLCILECDILSHSKGENTP